MNARNFISELESIGIQLWADGGTLRFRGPKGLITPDRRTKLADMKGEILTELTQSELPNLVHDESQRYSPFALTDVQGAYLWGRNEAFGYGGVACHMYVELEATEATGTQRRFDPTRLESAWNHLISRHDMLRAVFDPDGSQQVQETCPRYRIEVHDQVTAGPEQLKQALAQIRAEMGHRIYAPGSWPSFDLCATQAPDHSILHVSIDFMVADWASIETLLSELFTVYRSGPEELPPLPITFRDYVVAERSLRKTHRYQRDRRYWMGRINELPAAPQLPRARASVEPVDDKVQFHRRTLRLNRDEWSRLQAAGTHHGVTASCSVLAAYAEIIGRWSKHSQFTLNLTVLNRLPMHPQVAAIVGDFTSVSLLAMETAPTASFARRAAAITAQLFEDLDHRLFSGVEVMRELGRQKGRNAALMPVVFTSAIGLPKQPNADSAQDRSQPALPKLGFGITQTPQLFIDCQALDTDGELHVNWDYRDGVFPPGVVDDMFDSFESLLRRLARNADTWSNASPVSLPAAQAARRTQANATEEAAPAGLLHTAVIEHAQSNPQSLALISSSTTMRYGELLQRVWAVAGWLQTRDMQRGSRVAIVMDKGWEQIVAAVAVLAAGGVYVPIDLSQPSLRREAMIRQSEARLFLSQSPHISAIQAAPETICAVDTLDPCAEPAWRPPEASPDALAYMIFTSGSTGQPKGVMVSHAAALNTVTDINRKFSISAHDRVLGLSQLGFDLSVYDIFGTLSQGATLVLPEADRRTDPSHWAEVVETHGVTVWNSVPAQMQMLADVLGPKLRSLHGLRLVLLSGDWIPIGLPDQLRPHLPRLKIVSLGGATEASIWSIYHPIESVQADWSSIPYGKPLANQTFHVLDEHLRPCPEWTTGELYIGGAGLAQGYVGDPEQTRSRFIRTGEPETRLYRTGDLGRYVESGDIEFLGREDQQIKIHGHRIELGEIDRCLRDHPSVAQAIVLAAGSKPSARRIIAFVTLSEATTSTDTGPLHAFIRERLPEYMIPQRVIVIDEVPLTANQKVDRKRLLQILEEEAPKTGDDEPRSDLERRLAELWATSLGIARVGRDQDFFELGGDSLLAAKLVAAMREKIPEAGGMFFDALIREMLPKPTVSALAAALGASKQTASPPAVPSRSPLVELGPGPEALSYVFVHDLKGHIAPYRPLVAPVSAHGRVVGLLVTEAETKPYLRLDDQVLVQRRSTGYARLLKAQGHRNLVVVGVGEAAPLALEVGRYASEMHVDVAHVVLVSDDLFGTKTATWPEFDADGPQTQSVAKKTNRGLHAAQAAPYLGDVTIASANGPSSSVGNLPRLIVQAERCSPPGNTPHTTWLAELLIEIGGAQGRTP